MSRYCIVMTTCDSKELCDKITHELLKSKLAACIQVKKGNSFYHWNGDIQNDEEYILSIKTKTELYKMVETAITALHSYQTPEIIAIPIVEGSSAYLQWLESETK